MKSLSQMVNLVAHKKLDSVIGECLSPGFLVHQVDRVIHRQITQVLNDLIKSSATEELDREPYARKGSSEVYRNGYKVVSIPSFIGRLQLNKPAIRKGSLKLPILRSLKTAGQSFLKSLAVRFYLGGGSTRRVADELSEVFGKNISASTISQMTAVLDETIKEWEERALPANIRYLFLDATYIPFRLSGFTKDHALLVALGIDEHGQKHVLGFLLGDRENMESWSSLLQNLLDRGLDRNSLQLVISDEHGAIIKSVSEKLAVSHQYCLFHKLLNTKPHVASPDWKEFLNDLKSVYWAEDKNKSMEAAGHLRGKWGKKYPKAVEIALRNYDSYTQFFNVEERCWKTLRTSNLIERFNREIKRRVKNAGTLGQRMALFKLLYTVSINQEKRWRKVKTTA
jgi:transposase-like protein